MALIELPRPAEVVEVEKASSVVPLEGDAAGGPDEPQSMTASDVRALFPPSCFESEAVAVDSGDDLDGVEVGDEGDQVAVDSEDLFGDEEVEGDQVVDDEGGPRC